MNVILRHCTFWTLHFCLLNVSLGHCTKFCVFMKIYIWCAAICKIKVLSIVSIIHLPRDFKIPSVFLLPFKINNQMYKNELNDRILCLINLWIYWPVLIKWLTYSFKVFLELIFAQILTQHEKIWQNNIEVSGGMTKRRVMKRRVILESYDFGELCVNHAQTTPTFTNDYTQFLNSLDVFLNWHERVIFDVTLFR